MCALQLALGQTLEGYLLIEFIFPSYNQPLTQTLVDQLLGF